MTRSPRRRASIAAAVVVPAMLAHAALSPAVAQESTFTFGSGQALATIVSPVLRSGQISVGLIFGEASSSFQDETGRAESTSFTVPLLKAAGALTVCGEPGIDLAATLPPPVIANTADSDNTEATGQQQPPGGQGPLVQTVDAAPSAAGTARTDLAVVDFAGLATIRGAATTAAVGADESTMTRTATATVTIGDATILGGLVGFEGMRWQLTQSQVGPDDRSDERAVSGAFTMDGITVDVGGPLGLLDGLGALRIPIAGPDEVPGAVAQLNTLLGPIGLQVQVPEFRSSMGSDSHELTPLQVIFGGDDAVLSPALRQVLNDPIVAQAQNALLDGLFDTEDCAQLAGLFQPFPELNSFYNTVGVYAPIILAALSGVVGGGTAAIDIGGVRTALDDRFFPAPDFGSPQLQQPTPGSISTAVVDGATPPTTSESAGAPVRPPTRPTDQVVTVGATSLDGECRTTSPAGRPGCWLGRATLAGLLVILITLGTFAADELGRRRRTRGTNQTVEVSP